jgi:uncharacterized membrane protein YfcA
METLGLAAMALVGVTLGLMGGGGAILTVPIFLHLFHLTLAEATTYSLFLVGTVALMGAGLMARRGLVDLRAAVWFALPAFAAVAATRRFLVPALPAHFGPWERDQVLVVLFALLMASTAVAMLRPRPDSPSQSAGLKHSEAEPAAKVPGGGILQSLMVGLLTGVFGAGGGFLIVPALVLVHRLPMARAVGTSLLIIASNALVGFASDNSVRPHADWPLLLQGTAIAAVGMLIGSALSTHVPAARLRQGFGVFLLAMGAWMLWRSLK